MTVDPLFGPVILFGHGGTAVEVIADRAVALPPLNVPLARELVSRTRVAKLLAGYRDRPAADLDAIYATLGKLSQLLIDLPQVIELDINPLLADEKGVLALDARVRVARPAEDGRDRLAIRPYPRELEERMETMQERLAAIEARLRLSAQDMCPQCRRGRLRVVETSPHPEFGFAGIETHQVRCDRADCGYAGTRLYDPNEFLR